MREFAKTREWQDVDGERFRAEIAPLRKPAVLRGLAADWPAVKAGRESPEALCDHLRRFDNGKPAPAFLGPPHIKGRFWYRDDMRGFNYEQRLAPISQLLDVLLKMRGEAEPPAFYAGSVPILEHLPISTCRKTLPSWSAAAAGLPSSRPSRSPTFTSARSTSRSPDRP